MSKAYVKWEQTPALRHRLYSKLKQDPPPDPSPSPLKEQRFLQCFASIRPKVVLPSPLTRLRPCKPTTIHKFTKAFGSEKLNIFPFSYRRHDQFTVKEGQFFKYKGHKSFSMQQLSNRAKHTQSRCHISPVANGMINNEDGGLILNGVLDTD